MRFKSALLVALAAACASGCLRSTTTIELRPDGSGTIVQENAVSAQALAMLKGFATANPESKGSSPDLFGQEQAQKTAESMGVTFVSGEPIKTGELEGYRARYRFDDITKIKINMQQGADSMAGGVQRQPPFGFAFARGAASSVLTIQMPETPPTGTLPGLSPQGASDAEKAQAAQGLAMMKMMMKGMFLDVSLAVDGRIIKSNAPHVEGSKVTLLQVDFDKLLADETSLTKLEAAKDLKSLANIPGLKLAVDPTVVIEFSR